MRLSLKTGIWLVVGALIAPLLLSACQSMRGPLTPPARNDSTLRVASFNVHYIAENQTRLAWDRRKAAVTAALAEIDADIIGFQEMETFAGGSYNVENRQLDWVLNTVPGYAAGAYGDARVYPNTQPVLYRKSRFTQTGQGFFFFSDTPDVIYSRTFNGSWPAFCSWTELTELTTNRTLRIYNVHFEYKSMSNRGKSADLVAARLRPVVKAGESVILMGDINAFSFFPTTRTLTSIPLTLAPPAGTSFHFNRGLHFLPAIDHVFYSAQFAQAGATSRLLKRYNDVWPADHFPVVVDLKW